MKLEVFRPAVTLHSRFYIEDVALGHVYMIRLKETGGLRLVRCAGLSEGNEHHNRYVYFVPTEVSVEEAETAGDYEVWDWSEITECLYVQDPRKQIQT